MRHLKESLFASTLPYNQHRENHIQYPRAGYNEREFERRRVRVSEASSDPYLLPLSPEHAVSRNVLEVQKALEFVEAFPASARSGGPFDAAARRTCSIDSQALDLERDRLESSRRLRESRSSTASAVRPAYTVSQPAFGFSGGVQYVALE